MKLAKTITLHGMLLTGMLVTGQYLLAQRPVIFSFNSSVPVKQAAPLDTLGIAGIKGSNIKVFDGHGRQYANMPVQGVVKFVVSGALGMQTIRIYNAANQLTDSIRINVEAETNIDDGGTYKQLFNLLHSGMLVYGDNGVDTMDWNGKQQRFLVTWILDNYNTMKGMQYFTGEGKNLVDVMHTMQRKDGMIWSFIARNETSYYFETAYKKYGFFQRDGSCYFVRQPVENHVEYNYVCSIYKCWKASGDDAWMKQLLGSAAAALDYCVNDSLRWSKKYSLLKRALTIDSWDFQVDDEYTPKLGTGNPMLAVYGKTKFGIFYGDNTGYAEACNDLAVMYEHAGLKAEANTYAQRARQITGNLNTLAWNGKYFTHFIDEDETVKRNLGVDMATQISQSNAYSINRGISHQQSVAIINTYLNLKNNLPPGSPGEWYSIYPPFPRGFDVHDVMWQYMNGGVGGHVAGELALGAFDNGYENYGADILKRVLYLGNKYGDGKRVWFAYTGSFPQPPAVQYKAIDLSGYTNKDYSADLPKMPTGNQYYNNIPFLVDGKQKDHASGIAISSQTGFVKQVTIPINDTAKCLYFMHTGMGPVTDNVYGTITFTYEDSTEKTTYIFKEKHLSNWWFPFVHNDYAGVAWSGPNDKSANVGTWWAAFNNPAPGKKIASLTITASPGESTYILFGLTLANQLHYVKPAPESFGGPDNWAASTCMQALIEGLAGVKDSAEMYKLPVVNARWVSASIDNVNVTARYAASQGYVSYRFAHNKSGKQVTITATGNGDKMFWHVLLPANASVTGVTAGNKNIPFSQSVTEQSVYADFSIDLPGVKTIIISYK